MLFEFQAALQAYNLEATIFLSLLLFASEYLRVHYVYPARTPVQPLRESGGEI